MKKHRVLVLVDEDLVPPNVPASEVEDEWRMEWDVVTTLRRRGHTLLTIGVHDDLTPIRRSIEEFQPTVVFNLLEAFHGVALQESMRNPGGFLEKVCAARPQISDDTAARVP